MRLNWIFAAALVLSAFSCSKNDSGGGGGGEAPPVAEEARPDGSKSITTLIAAVQNLEKSKSNSGRNKANLVHQALSSSIKAKDQEKVQKMSQSLEKHSQANDCRFILPPEPKEDQSATPPAKGSEIVRDLVFELTGTNCPLSLKIGVHVLGEKEGKINVEYLLSFKSNTAEAEKEFGVKSLALTGLIGIEVQKEEKNPGMKMKADLKGDADLVEFGPTKFTQGFNAQIQFAGQGSQVMRTSGPSTGFLGLGMMLAEESTYLFGSTALKLNSSIALPPGQQKAVEKYFVNDKEVSAEEYAKYKTEISIPGFNNPADGGNGGDGGGTNPGPVQADEMCFASLYDASKISVEELEKSIQNPGPPRVKELEVQMACGASRKIASTHLGHKIQQSIKFSKDMVEYKIEVDNVNYTPNSVFIPTNSYDSNDLIIAAGPINVRLKCMPVEEGVCN